MAVEASESQENLAFQFACPFTSLKLSTVVGMMLPTDKWQLDLTAIFFFLGGNDKLVGVILKVFHHRLLKTQGFS